MIEQLGHMIELEDANGHCFIDLSKCLGISGPVQVKRSPESRKVVMPGYVIYILNSESNSKKLGIEFETNEDDEPEEEEAPKRKARKPMPWMRRSKGA